MFSLNYGQRDGPGEIRTLIRLLAKQLLYQLELQALGAV